MLMRLTQAIKQFSLALKHGESMILRLLTPTRSGCEYVHRSLPRLLTLWLDKYGYFKSKVHGADKKVRMCACMCVFTALTSVVVAARDYDSSRHARRFANTAALLLVLVSLATHLSSLSSWYVDVMRVFD